jgi:hypothetical protein
MGHLLVHGVMLALWAAGLPSPPRDVVELPTRMFGKVVVHHGHHLAIRAHCASCHGPGRVSRIGPLGAEEGHARCYRCHVERDAGPRECRGCHQGLAAKPGAAPPPPSPGGWRGLRWCMTTAEAHGALAGMNAPARGEFTRVVSSAGSARTQEYDVALAEPISPTALASMARLGFRNNALASIKLYFTTEDAREAYDALLADLVSTYGPPSVIAPPWEFWWILDDTSMLLLPGIPDVAPVELWLNDRVPAECVPTAPDADEAEPPRRRLVRSAAGADGR